MTLLEASQLAGWVNRPLVDETGDKIGKIATIYFDDDTQEPAWIASSTGWFGIRLTFVPVRGATADGDSLRVPFSKEKVKGAPNIEADGHLDQQEEEALYRYYGIDYAGPATTGPTGGGHGEGHDTSGPSTDDAMTRSEEELRVGTATREKGQVRLRKWVDTEAVSQTVPVTREEVRVEREPITEANVDQAMDGPEISEEEHEVTLYEDEVVAGRRAVPKERVRLDKDVRVDEETVTENLRKERIEVEGDVRR